MPAVSSSPALSVVDDSDPRLGELADVPPAPDGLLETLARVPDPRKRRGVRYRLVGVLAVALTATIAGAQSSTAIAEWITDAPLAERDRLGIGPGVPSESTIRRCLQRLAPDSLDELIGSWMWLRTSVIDGRRVIAFDGKTLRGARDAAATSPTCWPVCATTPVPCSADSRSARRRTKYPCCEHFSIAWTSPMWWSPPMLSTASAAPPSTSPAAAATTSSP